jgi:oligopeptide transport system substrate-binding protein
MLRQQLAEILGADLSIDVQDYKTWDQMQYELTYEGLSDGGDWGPYVDPGYFLDKYLRASRNTGTGFQDLHYDQMLAEANSILDPPARMNGLAECERYVLRSMPIVPLCYNTWSYLQKPFVRGLPPNLLDLRLFKYASIDTDWRPQ